MGYRLCSPPFMVEVNDGREFGPFDDIVDAFLRQDDIGDNAFVTEVNFEPDGELNHELGYAVAKWEEWIDENDIAPEDAERLEAARARKAARVA